jgi:hypothetical protein
LSLRHEKNKAPWEKQSIKLSHGAFLSPSKPWELITALKGLGGFLFAKVGLDVAVCKIVQRKYQWQRMVVICT